MAGRRVLYLAALLGCVVFYTAYGEWFAGLALTAMLGLPWLSLLLSLPAVGRFQMEVRCPAFLTMGEKGEAWLRGSSFAPLPPFRGQLYLKHCFTGEKLRYPGETGIPSGHCGAYVVTVQRRRVCDYLGLFAFPVKQAADRTVHIRPKMVEVKDLPDLNRHLARAWRPKFGGGFAENHELRLYRPGDSLNQIHWKLSAKTGKLTIREPMIPRRGRMLLTLNLRGTPEELDRKLGRLLWAGRKLLGQGLVFELRCLTGDGVLSFAVTGERELKKAMDAILRSPLASEGDLRSRAWEASWLYHIGGQADES